MLGQNCALTIGEKLSNPHQGGVVREGDEDAEAAGVRGNDAQENIENAAACRATFTESLAGIPTFTEGARHLSNIMVDCLTGTVVHIDSGIVEH
jgi:hypothetical protein